jgi:EF-hand domain pair/EF hand
MKRSTIIFGGLAVLLAVPAIAQMAGRDGPRKGAGEPVTRAQIETRIKDRFAAADTNRDGSITREEMAAQREAKQDDRRDRHFAMLDADKNGSVSRSEFDAMHERRAEMRNERRTEKGERGEGRMGMRHGRGHAMRGGGMGGHMFARADANADGRITLAEALAKPLEHFDMADANKDGTLTVEERKAAREKMREMWKDRRGGREARPVPSPGSHRGREISRIGGGFRLRLYHRQFLATLTLPSAILMVFTLPSAATRTLPSAAGAV